MTAVPTSRQAAAAGGRAIIPLTLGVIPFGLAYGVAASQVEVIDPWLAITASLLIIAGAAQLSLVGLIGDGAPWLVAVGTALVINARFALYSAALAPAFRAFPRAWRFALPYMMTDQAAALSLDYNAR
ncbi:MAG: AzlC family ABC transporter permease, partial [Dehalococcoidia bacterium]|nr:AzlC family ABC transporter permease [Dehalococcoidia bacterium]